MHNDKFLKNYIKKTVKKVLDNKEMMDSIAEEAKKQDEDELEIISVSHPKKEQKEGKRVLVPLPEDIYYILSLHHSGEKLTAAEQDIIRNHPLKDREEFIKKFKSYLPGVKDADIPKAVAVVMKNYLKFMTNLEKTAMQIIFAERILALADIKKKKQILPPLSSQELMDFWKEYKKGKFTRSMVKTKAKEHLNLLAEEAEVTFDRERKEFYELINDAFSEISDISNEKKIHETLIKNIRKFISERYSQEYKPLAMKTEEITGAEIEKIIEKREFPFMPIILEIIIKSENLTSDPEIAPLIKNLEIAMFNLNIAAQMGVEDAMNAYKHHILIYFYKKAAEKISR